MARFTNLRLDGSGAFTLRFTSPGLTPVTADVNVTQTPASLTIITHANGSGTGLPFTTASDEGVSGIGCVYGSADQADGFLIMTRIESADPAAAVEEFASSVPMAARASATQVAGRPSMSLVDPSATFVIIDLDGIPGEDGHVLSVVWLAPPAGTDAGAVITRLAEAAIAAL